MILIQCVSLHISSCPTHSSDTHCLTGTYIGISLAALRASNDLVDTIISSHIRGMETLTCPEPFASTTAGFSTTCTSLLQDMLNSVSTGCASVFDLAPTRQEFIFVRCVQSSSEPTHLPPTPVPTSERTCHIVLSNTAIDCVRCAQHDVHHARRTASVELQFVRTLPSVPYPSMRSPFIRSPSFPTSSPSHRYQLRDSSYLIRRNHPRDPLSCPVVSSTTTTLEQRDVSLRVVLSPLILSS